MSMWNWQRLQNYIIFTSKASSGGLQHSNILRTISFRGLHILVTITISWILLYHYWYMILSAQGHDWCNSMLIDSLTRWKTMLRLLLLEELLLSHAWLYWNNVVFHPYKKKNFILSMKQTRSKQYNPFLAYILWLISVVFSYLRQVVHTYLWQKKLKKMNRSRMKPNKSFKKMNHFHMKPNKWFSKIHMNLFCATNAVITKLGALILEASSAHIPLTKKA